MSSGHNELSLGLLENGKLVYESIKAFDGSALEKISNAVNTEKLYSLSSIYEKNNRAIDVYCKNGLAYIVILEVATGTTYTYLNPNYTRLFERQASHNNILICPDMEIFEKSGEHEDALRMVEIGGNDCPMLHICDNKNILIKAITRFLESGIILPEVDWLKS